MHFVSSTVTACAAYRASNEKRAFPSHDVCQVQDSCGSQGAGVVKSGTGSLVRETPSQQTRAQSHSHPFLRSLPWSLFCISLICPVLECLDGFRCVTGCHSFHRIFGSIFHPQPDPGKPRITIARQALVSIRKTHESFGLFCGLPITGQYPRHDGATAAPQRRAATRLHCNCQDTGILTPQWPQCACDLQSTVIASVSVFFCVRHSTRAVFARISGHGSPNPHFSSTSITKIDGSCSSASRERQVHEVPML